MTIYSVIKGLAQKQEISVYQMEHDLGFPNGIISKWNHSMPGADKLQLVADYLGVTTAFVLNKSKEN
ncbi:helix-turn-helix transcriptional regulator [Lactiplantibacillus plantarum]|uniref:helix-turn-helix transcriptional regulator n=1 Tax=Lactiplantibacillus plantarum TaxID=1590 RepID=UPI0015EC69F3|nr:helix-turn-helix transcriptional regulator [Lactiplantibacillus plantarum]QLQ50933.1 helix-turn-helix transcriptional regulator [Lactiplantibacillus plantarum]